MASRKKIDLTTGRIEGHVFRMVGPFSLGIVALLSAGIIDTIYLGRLTSDSVPDLGVMALAAIGFAYPLTFLGNSANIGLGAGTLSAVSRAIGQGNLERSRRHGAAAILMAIVVMSLLVTCMTLLMPTVLDLMGARGTIRDMASIYLAISLPGLVIVSISMMCSNVLRANGEAALPSAIMISGAIINIVIDPFLIFGWWVFPRLEVAGAAIATVVGHGFASLIALYVVWFHRKAITFAGITVASLRRAWSIIGRVGIPAALTNIIIPLATAVAVGIIANKLTTIDVAAFTLTSRAELISVGLLYALSACIGAITGQNGGAGYTARVRTTFKICYFICLGWSTFMAMILAVFAPQIAGLFTLDAEVIAKSLPYFYIVPITIFGYGFVFVSSAGFNALGRPEIGLAYTTIRSLGLYIAFIYVGVEIYGLWGGFVAIALANILSGALAAIWSMTRAPMTAKRS